MIPAVERLRTTVACLLLAALVFAQEAGRVVSDTKLDLTADPVGLLARSLHLWDPEGGAGQLQNQAYGYLFPMGPFHLALQALGLPDWAVQRLWQSLVLCVALVGAKALAQRLGVGTASTQLLAGVAYALAARPVSQLGAISVEVWPYALAPWVLVPLVTGAERGDPRRAAGLSGLAVLAAGGVNAAATLAVLPLAMVWLAVQDPGPRRRRLVGWWAVSVVCATAWWVGPLALLAKYSPPFLDVIESASTTTAQTGLWSVLTGNDLWLQYLAIGEPARPAGFLLVTSGALVLCATAVTVLGMVGLLRRDLPHRGLLVGGVLMGLLVVGAGHVGSLGSPFAAFERDLLDGPLAAFRNVHKYDLLLRLPLVLGLAHAASAVRLEKVRLPGLRPGLRPFAVLAAVALAGAASPALGSLQPPGSFAGLPGYWQETADYLHTAEKAAGRALVVPAAPFGDYAWGRPQDEPLQVLATSPWVVRDAVPLGGPGVTRVLDVVEEVLRSGRGSPALSAFLARAGIRHLVVRNDLDSAAAGSVRPLVVHASLAASPGLLRVASFGPPIGAGVGTGPTVFDANLLPTYAAVEVFEVTGSPTLVTTLDRTGTQRVSGGPESLLPLMEQGLVGPATATRLAGEDASGGAEIASGAKDLLTITDGYRDREVDVGRAGDNASATLGAGTGARFPRPVHDYLPVPAERSRTKAVVHGFTAVAASSSASDADALLLRGRDHHPTAAFDGDGATAWVSGDLSPLGQWVEAQFPPTELTAIDLTVPVVAGVGARPTRVRVTTDVGSQDVDLVDGRAQVGLVGTTERVRVTILQATAFRQIGVVALEVRLRTAAGEQLAQRGLRVAPDSATSTGGRAFDEPVAIAFASGRRDRPGCLPLGDRPVCAFGLALGDEDDEAIDRTLTLDRPALYGVAVGARARPGPALDALLQQGQPVTVTATSSAVPDASGRPATVLDRDLRTGWAAGPLDATPALRLRLRTPARLTGVQVVVDPFFAVSRPRAVEVTVDGRPLGKVALGPDGTAGFPPVTGRVVVVALVDVEQRTSLGAGGGVNRLPVGVTELRLLGPGDDVLRQRVDRLTAVALPCGEGPSLAVDGDLRLATRVATDLGTLVDGGPVSVLPCQTGLELARGEHRLRMSRTPLLQVSALTLRDLARPPLTRSPSRVQQVRSWGSVDRRIAVAPGDPAWLVVREAFNEGWTATFDGRPMVSARLDGWQQGFALPAGGGEVRLLFAPDRSYRVALGGGAALVLVLVGLCVRRPRRRTGPVVWRSRRRWSGPTFAVLAVGVVGGLPGLAVLLGLAVLTRWRRVDVLVLVPAGALLAAGVLIALRPWPDHTLLEGPVQALCLVAVAGLALSLGLRGAPVRRGSIPRHPAASRPGPGPAPTTAAASPAAPATAMTPRRRAG